jgi:hypothetical protein
VDRIRFVLFGDITSVVCNIYDLTDNRCGAEVGGDGRPLEPVFVDWR